MGAAMNGSQSVSTRLPDRFSLNSLDGPLGRSKLISAQGLSPFHMVFLPDDFEKFGSDYFRATVNAFLSGYYTKPGIATPSSELTERAAEMADWCAQCAKTLRACIYMLQMGSCTRCAAKHRG
ncbi:hypothetical protein BD289DRAFT_6278 [Coniella lustricola]|uniref:Uncharacterized protein n=1 Tax=Coniella lustricola TaxID=2025994 RepID=A0A2T3ANU5_9PEZI|nr:hypothetical protein BD289DRAFT_6278 [Coniella lustricola]